jgi:hypothetical protein
VWRRSKRKPRSGAQINHNRLTANSNDRRGACVRTLIRRRCQLTLTDDDRTSDRAVDIDGLEDKVREAGAQSHTISPFRFATALPRSRAFDQSIFAIDETLPSLARERGDRAGEKPGAGVRTFCAALSHPRSFPSGREEPRQQDGPKSAAHPGHRGTTAAGSRATEPNRQRRTSPHPNREEGQRAEGGEGLWGMGIRGARGLSSLARRTGCSLHVGDTNWVSNLFRLF